MMLDEILSHCQSQIEAQGFIEFDDEILRDLSPEQVAEIQESFGATALLKLPAHEIAFFEWLKTSDTAVWDDLWSESESLYQVSLAHLGNFTGSNFDGAFAICDLISTDNYFLSPALLLERESKAFIDAISQRFVAKQSLTVSQALALEASVKPVDVWHFAYNRGIDLEKAKQAVHSLSDDRVFVYVPKAEHLAEYFEVK